MEISKREALIIHKCMEAGINKLVKTFRPSERVIVKRLLKDISHKLRTEGEIKNIPTPKTQYEWELFIRKYYEKQYKIDL